MPCLQIFFRKNMLTNCNGELGCCSVILSLFRPPKQKLLQRSRCMSCSSLPWRQHPTEQLQEGLQREDRSKRTNLPGSNRDFQAGLNQHRLVARNARELAAGEAAPD